MKPWTIPALLTLALLPSCFVFAQFAEIPLTNWTVPPYRNASAPGGYTTMVDISPGVGFTAMQPCRVVDTRGGGVFTGAYGPPAMVANTTRPFDIDSAPHCPGIPAGVEAYSLNFTVTQTAGAPGDIRAWPTGTPPVQITSVLNWTVANATVANATIIPAGTGGSIDVYAAGTATHLLIDINGYFADDQNAGQSLIARSATAAAAIIGENTSTALSAFGIHGVITSAAAGLASAGVRGTNFGTGTDSFGVSGAHAGSGWGVYGFAAGTSVGAVGVRGSAGGNAGNIFGVKGSTLSAAMGSAGVKGVSGHGDPLGDSINCAGCRTAGVFGVDASTISGAFGGAGVLGVSRSMAVRAFLLATSGTTIQASAYLGLRPNISPTLYAVYGEGNYGGSGAKYFVEPHPYDASKTIRYVALEGPEAGTYFRGRGKFQRGIAVIEVPEDFRLVTDAEGLSVQVTPIGEMASVAVVRIGLDRIVVRGSRNVEFFYTVNGVRRTFKDVRPIAESSEYMPESSDATIPAFLSEGQKQSLVANGTYNADGTVNMETARRLGWDRMWEERSRPLSRPPEREP